jgi:hypothetical protein
METVENRVQDLTIKINKVSNQLDEDYTSLVSYGVSEDIIETIFEETLTLEIEKLVVLFEALNPDVFITGIQRLADEHGNMIVNLEWNHIEGD